MDHKLQFQEHIEYIKKKIAKRIGAVYKSQNLLPLKYRKLFANSLMLLQFDYLDIIWCRAGKTNLKELDILYNKKTAKNALDYDIRESSIKVYCDMKWLPFHLRRQPGYFTAPPPLEKFVPPLEKCVCETLRITFSKRNFYSIHAKNIKNFHNLSVFCMLNFKFSFRLRQASCQVQTIWGITILH